MTIIGLIAVAALLALSVVGIFSARQPWGPGFIYGAVLLIAAVVMIAALATLVSGDGSSARVVLPLGLPWVGAHFRVDALSAFFLTVVNLGAAAASLYGLGQGAHEHAPQRVLPFYPAFIAGMNLVLLADDAFSFLVSWEVMSLASWALVMAHHRDRGNARAGFVYILMASFGAMALLLAFGILAGPSGSYAFDTMRADPPAPLFGGVVLILALIGAGSKAGLIPLHVWLPLAHPAAPSHVSALMSGVMTKVAVYGFMRVAFDLAGPLSWWWGALALALGGGSAVVGILSALMQNDIKRMLAYSTIENIGIIFIGLGLALAFEADNRPGPAALALTAALFHVFNHALFKSVLFFGAGAVLSATGERGMERLGGLIHRMPMTSLAFLVACLAISALPPLNGFASEWLILQAILLSPDLPQWALKFLVPSVGALLALSAALAAACFVRAYGVTFLGRPRSPVAESAREVDRCSIAAMATLAILCVLAGVLPGVVIDGLGPVAERLLHARMPWQTSVPWLSIVPISEGRSSYNGLLVFVFAVVSASLAAFAIHRFASRGVRRAPAWDCGFPDSSPMTQYTASSFRAADPPSARDLIVSRPRTCRDARARRPRPRAIPGRPQRSFLGPDLHADRQRRGRRRRSAEWSAIPDHPQLSQSGVRGAGRPAAGAGVMALILSLAVQGMQMLLVLALAPLLTGFVRKVKARLLRRRGPPLSQPYRDLSRLLRKEVVLADNASWLFRVIPYLIFGATWVAAALVPTFGASLQFSWCADLIAIIALLGAARFFLTLAGMDVGTSFGGIGSSREAMFATLAEPAMIMIVFTLALIADRRNSPRWRRSCCRPPSACACRSAWR